MEKVFLDTYTLQSDCRIRLPKSAIANINAVPGESRISIYYDVENHSLVLQIKPDAPDCGSGCQGGDLSHG